ncbi:MAG: c-type cytochrome [Gemmatimonadota bacterium]
MSDSHHVNYRKIYFTLLILLVISVAGPFIGIGWITLVTAFGIALIKANMVIQNFMHLKWERRIAKLVLATSLALMVLFYGAVAPDIQNHEGRNWVNDAALAATERGIAPPHDEAAPAEEHAPAPAEGATVAPAAFDAAASFAMICSSCHGPTGAGDGPGAAALTPKPANFTDPAFWADKTDAELAKAIREGGAAVGKSASMPPWGSVYDEAKAGALVGYLKTLRH